MPINHLTNPWLKDSHFQISGSDTCQSSPSVHYIEWDYGEKIIEIFTETSISIILAPSNRFLILPILAIRLPNIFSMSHKDLLIWVDNTWIIYDWKADKMGTELWLLTQTDVLLNACKVIICSNSEIEMEGESSIMIFTSSMLSPDFYYFYAEQGRWMRWRRGGGRLR